MKDVIIAFFANNWDELLLIFVGALALVIYILQERKKRSEAASLIVSQIDELQSGFKDVVACIVDRKLNSGAFYEMPPLLETDYWAKYKHYFVRKMDSKSYSTINLLYKYAALICDQQILMKNLQKNSFFVIQNILATSESQLINGGVNNMPFDHEVFWKEYRLRQSILKEIINGQAFTEYIPEQIRISLENAVAQYSVLEISGSDGYKILNRISARRI